MCPAIVVEPTSTAIPKTASRSPGQAAMTARPAVDLVDGHGDRVATSAQGGREIAHDGQVHLQARQPPLPLERGEQALRLARTGRPGPAGSTST